jgi:uncharacterized membrane protein
MTEVVVVLAVAAALGSGGVAGFFFTFSVCVMRALGCPPPDQGIAAMQAINVVLLNPWFFTAFFETAAVCILLTDFSLFNCSASHAIYLLAASLLYLAGSILVTMAFNVPLNDALAAINPNSPEGAALWTRYLANWTAWNHMRTAVDQLLAQYCGAQWLMYRFITSQEKLATFPRCPAHT